MLKSLTEIIESIINKITELFGDEIDTRVGTVIRDLFITPISYAISDLYSALNQAIESQNLITATGSDLERIAATYGITRGQGTYATGLVRFYSFNPVGNIIIPSNTEVYAFKNEQRIDFVTVYTIIINTQSPIENNINSPFYGAYYAEVLVQCKNIGTIGNVSIGDIRYSNINNVDGVYNLESFNNAIDGQSDDSLRQSILNIIYSKNLTEGGYKQFALQNSSVFDVRVIPPDNENSFMPYIIGNIDIICIPKSIGIYSEEFIYSGQIRLTKKPLKRVIGIYKINPDNSKTPVNYVVNYDVSSVYRYSIYENTYIYSNELNH